MRAIIISDADAKALLDKLELTKFRNERPKSTDVDSIHRAFHYEVCRWLQEHGADIVNR